MNYVEYINRLNDVQMNSIKTFSNEMCVIAPDNPTINECILHGKNGLLYDLKNPEELDPSNLSGICENVVKSENEDYELWAKTKHEILIDLAKPDKNAV